MATNRMKRAAADPPAHEHPQVNPHAALLPEDQCPARLSRAEAVLQKRTGRIRLVLEQCLDSRNHQAVLRTAEALGVQYIYTILPASGSMKSHQTNQKSKKFGKDSLTATSTSKVKRKITKGCQSWLTIRSFESIR